MLAGGTSAVWDGKEPVQLTAGRVWETGLPVWRGQTPRGDPYTLGANIISRPIWDVAPGILTPLNQPSLHLKTSRTLASQYNLTEIIILDSGEPKLLDWDIC
jgi:hypothetical protein